MKGTHQLGSIWNKKISATRAFLVILGLVMVVLWQQFHFKPYTDQPQVATQAQETCPPEPVVKYIMKEYKFAKPLLLSDNYTRGDISNNQLGGIESGVNSIIEAKKSEGQISSAAVYMRQFNNGDFFTINEGERYHPASMAKVIVMIVTLRDGELHPGFLDKTLSFSKNTNEVRQQIYAPSAEIQPNVKYTIRNLLYHSIVKSDNIADQLLGGNMNMEVWTQLFADLELPKPELANINYSLTAAEYSRFLRILFNATYLSNEDADYALSLLAKTEFKEGMTKQLPPDILVAHKFGEFGRTGEQEQELHESGIIYIDNNPVLLTIMTKGNDAKKLPGVISEISKYVYDQMKAKLN